MAELFYQPSPAPGRESSGQAPAQQPVQGPPPGGAEAARPGFDPTMIVLLLVPLLLFFFMSRSQNKKQKELETSLKVGEKVILRSGIVGKIIETGDRMKIEIAPGVKVEVLKTAVEGKDAGEKPKEPAAAKDAKDAKDKEPPSKDKKA